MTQPAPTLCPLCSRPAEALAEVSYSAAEAAQHFVLAEEYPERHARLVRQIQSLWKGNDCSILRCRECSFRFAWPFVAGDAGFYNLAYPHSDYPIQRWEFDVTAQVLASQPPLDGPVLEIGSGFGYFLRKISPRLVAPERVVAVEYNDVARHHLLAQGYKASGVDIRDPAHNGLHGKLAAVFMFQVIEHMDDLSSLVRRLSELARPGASVFMAVPNPQRIAFNESHSSLRDMPPNHISGWSEAACHALATRAGWTLQDWRVQPMRWGAFIRQDLVYTHMQRAQRSGSLANRLRALPRNRARRGLEAALALLSAPSRVPAWWRVARDGASVGDSAWVHFRVPN